MARTFTTLLFSVLIGICVTRADSETHTIHFNNQCGHGTPQLVQGGHVLANGTDYTFQGPGNSCIAYLQTGDCLLNGENCLLVEINVNNAAAGCAGCGSFADMSLISPHELNVPTSISWINGCNGQGVTCSTPDCSTAYHESDDNKVLIYCQADNVGLEITFCPNGGAAPPSFQASVASNQNLATQTTQSFGGAANTVSPTQTTQTSSSASNSPNTDTGVSPVSPTQTTQASSSASNSPNTACPVAPTQTTQAGSSPSAPPTTYASTSPVVQTQPAQACSSSTAPPNTVAGANPAAPTQTTQASSSVSTSPITVAGACPETVATTQASSSSSAPLSDRRMMRHHRIHV